MTEEQYQAYEKHRKEKEKVLDIIAALPIGEEWIARFSKLALYRNWRKITSAKEKRLIVIAKADSPSVATIVEQKHTKISTEMMEKIASVVTEEKDRAKICNYLLNKSWKDAKRDVLLILSYYADDAA